MANETNVIIGISPGTRNIALVVLVGTELRDWRERGFHGPWSKLKLQKIIEVVESMLNLYQPRAVACKNVHHSRTSSALDRVNAELKNLIERKNQKLHLYSYSQLIKTLVPETKSCRRDMIHLLSNLYPTLQPLALREKVLKRPYHWRLFDALGC